MASPFIFSRPMTLSVIFLSTLCFAACNSAKHEEIVENQGTEASAPSSTSSTLQATTASKPLGCKSPEAKGEKLCAMLLVGGQGEAVIGTKDLKGSAKLEYDDEGRLETIASFDPLHPDKAQWTQSFTYDSQDRPDSIVTKEDQDFSDNAFDCIETLSVTYPTNHMVAKVGSKLDRTNSTDPLVDVQEVELHNNASYVFKLRQETNAQTQTVMQAVVEADKKDQTGKVTTQYVSRYHGDPNVPANLDSSEVTVFNYTAEGVLESKNYSFCQSNVGGIAFNCEAFDSSLNPNPNRDQLVLVDTKFHFDGEKLIATETTIDGDRGNLPADKQNGTVDHTYECKMKYDDGAVAPGGLPQQIKDLGFSGKEVLKSIDCKKDGQGAGSFAFEYKSLWEVKGVAEPFSGN